MKHKHKLYRDPWFVLFAVCLFGLLQSLRNTMWCDVYCRGAKNDHAKSLYNCDNRCRKLFDVYYTDKKDRTIMEKSLTWVKQIISTCGFTSSPKSMARVITLSNIILPIQLVSIACGWSLCISRKRTKRFSIVQCNLWQ